jgi:hypothetical protein
LIFAAEGKEGTEKKNKDLSRAKTQRRQVIQKHFIIGRKHKLYFSAPSAPSVANIFVFFLAPLRLYAS